MRASSVAATAFLFSAMTVFAAPVEWDFPRMGSCHEGIAFGDGKTGVLVWGGGDEILLATRTASTDSSRRRRRRDCRAIPTCFRLAAS